MSSLWNVTGRIELLTPSPISSLDPVVKACCTMLTGFRANNIQAEGTTIEFTGAIFRLGWSSALLAQVGQGRLHVSSDSEKLCVDYELSLGAYMAMYVFAMIVSISATPDAGPLILLGAPLIFVVNRAVLSHRFEYWAKDSLRKVC